MTRSRESIECRRAARRAWGQTEAGRAYMAAWRKGHRVGENARTARLRAIPGWRVVHEPEHFVPIDVTPLPRLYPELNHGTTLSFWEDELRMDLAQERALAVLEGVDADARVREYRLREQKWTQTTRAPFEWEDA